MCRNSKSKCEPKLFDIVTKHMIHGPCGNHNMNSVCMEKKFCKKDFPKEFNPANWGNVWEVISAWTT